MVSSDLQGRNFCCRNRLIIYRIQPIQLEVKLSHGKFTGLAFFLQSVLAGLKSRKIYPDKAKLIVRWGRKTAGLVRDSRVAWSKVVRLFL